MQSRVLSLFLILMLISTFQFKAQNNKKDSSYKKWLVGIVFLLLGNLDNVNKSDFIQINIGYRLSPKNVIFLELKKSKFAWPLGIQGGNYFDAPGENYSGYLRQKVIGLAYNRFWWKGLFTGIHTMNAFQKYYNENDKKIAKGYTLFMTYRLG